MEYSVAVLYFLQSRSATFPALLLPRFSPSLPRSFRSLLHRPLWLRLRYGDQTKETTELYIASPRNTISRLLLCLSILSSMFPLEPSFSAHRSALKHFEKFFEEPGL